MLSVAARVGINDAGLPGMAGQKIQDLALQLVPPSHLIADVGPVKARQGHTVCTNAKLSRDIGAGLAVCRGGQCNPRHAGQPIAERLQAAIFGPEIMAPLRHAMRFIDGNQRDFNARHQGGETVGQRAFRRDVKQIELTIGHVPPHLATVDRLAVQRGSAHAGSPQRPHLILHQRDQRGNHQRRARPDQRRYLIADRLAGPGGHDRQHIATSQHIGDDRFLRPPKFAVAKHPAQHGTGIGCGRVHRPRFIVEGHENSIDMPLAKRHRLCQLPAKKSGGALFYMYFLLLVAMGLGQATPPGSPPAAAAVTDADPATAAPAAIPALTQLALEMVDPVTTRTAKRGDRFAIKLAEPLQLPGIFIPAGTMGHGEVVHTQKAGAAGRAGELILAARCLDVNGACLKLRSLKIAPPSATERTDLALAVGIAAGPVGFLVSGGHRQVAAGAALTAITAETTSWPITANPQVQPGQEEPRS
jgi:hypothetical protein